MSSLPNMVDGVPFKTVSPPPVGLFYTRLESSSQRVDTLRVFFSFSTGQVVKIPPLKDFDAPLPLPFSDGLDVKQELDSYSACGAMDVLDLYETGEWSAACSPCSELFEDSDLASGSDLDESCGYLDDISIDFASYLDPAVLSTSPDDLCKYLTPDEMKGVKKELLGHCGFAQEKGNPVVNPPKPAVTSELSSVVENEQPNSKLHSVASQLKAPSSRSNRRASSKKQLPKNSEEYRRKRERNNVAVRKSRFKSKQKFAETQRKVDELVDENDHLHNKVSLLTKELNVLRKLFASSGAFKDHGVAAALLAHGIPNNNGLVPPPNKHTGSCR